MNGHGNTQAAALFPHGIQARVVDGNELAGTVTHAEAEVLENLQAAGAAAHGVIKLLDHFLAEVRIVDLAPIHLSKHHETVRIGLHHFIEDALQLVAPHAGKDDDLLHIGGIHAANHLGWRNLLAVNPAGIVDMIVNINHGELGAGNLVDGGVQHGMRMVVPQKQSHAFGGVGILGVLDVLSRNRAGEPGSKREREKKGKAKMIPERVPARFPGNVHFFNPQ